MASKALDVALDKISKKYPNFSAESGKKVVDSLQDAFKSYQKKKQSNSELKISEPEKHSLIDIPSNSGVSSNPNHTTPNHKIERKDSFYENFEDYNDNNPSTEKSTQQFPTELTNGTKIEKDINPSNNQQLSVNPSSGDKGTDSEKKELLATSSSNCPPKPPEGSGSGAPNISQYLQKKSLAQGMMDLALLSANTNQLRYILDSRSDNAYFSVSLSLIISSLVLQIVVGLMLVWNSSYNVQRRSGFASADRINNLSIFGVFLITLINVFVSTFGNVPASSSASTSTTVASSSSSAGVILETTSAMSIISSVEPVAVAEPPPQDIPME